jgi:hypothetical protein
MVVGVQISYTMGPNQTIDFYTWGWNPVWAVVWTVVSTTPSPSGPQVEWNVEVERSATNSVTYHIFITNLTPNPLGVEGRYAILNL